MKLRTKPDIKKTPVIKRQTDFSKEITENKNVSKQTNPKTNTNLSRLKVKGTNDMIKIDETDGSEKLNIDKSENVTSKEVKSLKESKPKKQNIHKSHRERLKDQFLNNGLLSLTDIQKLELLLFFAIPQKDTNPIAHALLDRYKTIREVLNAEPYKLMEIKGIKKNTATLIKFVNSLFSYINLPDEQGSISSAIEARDYCAKLFIGCEVEQFYVICLSKSNKIKGTKMIKSGSLDEVNVQIRSVTEFALENKCSRIIVSHNHPTGSSECSDEDCAFTYSLLCSCMLNSIDILDHIIVGKDSVTSMASQKILQRLKAKASSNVQVSKDNIGFLSSLSENYIIDN